MRYKQQEIFNKIGRKGQKKLSSSTITIIGLGAIGSVASELLTRTGIGNLILIDRDHIELENLHRQNLFNEEDIGKQKAIVAKAKLEKINNEVQIKAFFDNFDSSNTELAKGIILDCTDNLETRFLINEVSIKNNIPWIYASAIANSGYIFNIIPGKPCFRCIFKHNYALGTCSTIGVINTITSLIGTIQANEAIKILLNKDYEKKLIHFNIWNNELTKIKVKRNKRCPACNKKFEYLTKENKLMKFCGSNSFLIRGNFNYEKIKESIKRIEKIRDFGNSFYFNNITVFKDKVLIKANSEKKARSLFSKYIGS